jgi:hypothetical protein
MSEYFNDLGGEVMPELQITKIADGLGMNYGTGTISALELEHKDGNEDVADLTDQAIQSPNILVKVDSDEHGKMLQDDGCGDGRPVITITAKIDGVKHFFDRSRRRAKVFGGGAVMTLATRIALGHGAPTLNQTIDASIAQMADSGLDFGAHTDNQAGGEDCGCGAIDKAPSIIAAASHFRSDIAETIAALNVDTTGLEKVQDSYDAYADIIKNKPYSGRQSMNSIVDAGKIVKELADDHRETRVILNMVEGYTVDQNCVRVVTNGRAQVFAVDVWHLKQLAEKLYSDETEQLRGLQGMLVYMLATAAVLTKGDLPVYVVSPQTAAVA